MQVAVLFMIIRMIKRTLRLHFNFHKIMRITSKVRITRITVEGYDFNSPLDLNSAVVFPLDARGGGVHSAGANNAGIQVLDNFS